MNIRDKQRLYAEIARVLRPGGTFVAYDILQGPGGPVRYPTPWSADGTTSFLVDPAGLRRHLAEAGFEVLEERDRRAESLAWFKARAAAAAAKGGPPPLSLRLVLGAAVPGRVRQPDRQSGGGDGRPDLCARGAPLTEAALGAAAAPAPFLHGPEPEHCCHLAPCASASWARMALRYRVQE